jgi:hypothetical protein
MRICGEVLWELKHDGHEYKELACDFPDIPMEASDFVPDFFHDAMLAYTRPRRNGFVYVELGHLVSDNPSVLQQDMDSRQRRQLAARPAPARSAERAHTQLGLRRQHAQQLSRELPVPVRPCTNASVGSVLGERAYTGMRQIRHCA